MIRFQGSLDYPVVVCEARISAVYRRESHDYQCNKFHKKQEDIVPTYDYRCNKCGKIYELIHSIKDDDNKPCPECLSSDTRRLISGGGGAIMYGTDTPVSAMGREQRREILGIKEPLREKIEKDKREKGREKRKRVKEENGKASRISL